MKGFNHRGEQRRLWLVLTSGNTEYCAESLPPVDLELSLDRDDGSGSRDTCKLYAQQSRTSLSR